MCRFSNRLRQSEPSSAGWPGHSATLLRNWTLAAPASACRTCLWRRSRTWRWNTWKPACQILSQIVRMVSPSSPKHFIIYMDIVICPVFVGMTLASKQIFLTFFVDFQVSFSTNLTRKSSSWILSWTHYQGSKMTILRPKIQKAAWKRQNVTNTSSSTLKIAGWIREVF